MLARQSMRKEVKSPDFRRIKPQESRAMWLRPVIPGVGKRVILKYIPSLRPAWATWDPVSIINR